MNVNKRKLKEFVRDLDVVILAGGLATRLNNLLADTPKILAPIHGMTFFDLHIKWLESVGVSRVILCLGHLHEKVLFHVSTQSKKSISIETSIEPEPLGTAGAIRNASHLIKRKRVLVMNGDTWLDTNLVDFFEAHIISCAEISILCVAVSDASSSAKININDTNMVSEYEEKNGTKHSPGLISAGIYMFSASGMKKLLNSNGASLEYDFFQKLPKNFVHGYNVGSVDFIDIGTPDSFKKMADILPSP